MQEIIAVTRPIQESAEVTSEADRSARVLPFLKERIAARIGIPPEQVTEQSVLVELGLQSIDAVLVCGEVEDEFGIELNPSSIFEHEALGGFAQEVIGLVEA
ncbi:acyl carrier protein [Microbaculum marinum]|uniref:Acyl carrier protein n=1 Tax=Microbaculum marinum TaxID=1764581 RepID=A0AAW9RL50_9HYPH